MIPQRYIDIYKPTIRTMHRLALGVTELYFSIHQLERTHKLIIVGTSHEEIMTIREDLFPDGVNPRDRKLGVDFDSEGNITRVYGDVRSYGVIDDPLREGMEWQGGA